MLISIKMVIWADWLASIASGMDVGTTDAGILFSLGFTILMILVVLIVTKGESPTISVSFTALFATLFFLVLGWYPVWMGSVLALVLSIIIAAIISRGV